MTCILEYASSANFLLCKICMFVESDFVVVLLSDLPSFTQIIWIIVSLFLSFHVLNIRFI